MSQRLSFEVALILRFFVIIIQYKTITLRVIRESNLLLEWNIIWAVLWFVLSLIETNRAPFDLLEGERELIRGFNIELGRVLFVFLFLREYGIIIILMLFMSISTISLSVSSIFFVCLLLFIRRCFPRVRYDIMMRIMWLVILPLTIFYFFGMTLLL
jgi:NADH:ubiquinone oxidoreductase subunit H